MFELERAIADWRRGLAQNGLQNSDVTNELEAHLRDSIDVQIAAGAEPRLAFNTALEQMGTSTELKSEFQCAGVSLKEPIHMKNALCVLAGIPVAASAGETPKTATE